MVLALIFIGIGVFVGMSKKPKKHWYLIHKIFTFVAILITIIGMLLVGGPNFNNFHEITGFAAILLLCSDFVGGIYIFLKKKTDFRQFHIWMGRLTGLVLSITLIIGIVFSL